MPGGRSEQSWQNEQNPSARVPPDRWQQSPQADLPESSPAETIDRKRMRTTVPAPGPLQEPRPRSQAAVRSHSQSTPRMLLEALVVLAVAVSVFRTFVLEGFMITTGSMAPALWGYHYRVTCPDCSFEFALGIESRDDLFHSSAVAAASENDQPAANSVAVENDSRRPKITCPNCEYAYIQPESLLLNEGDQLLVDKQAFLWQLPRRWSAVVFRNPRRPTQAYAKRIIGLPGEVITLRDGDIHVGELIQRKSLPEQREMRILISDSRHVPQFQDQDWRPAWSPADAAAGEVWKYDDQRYRFVPPADRADSGSLWLNFSAWKRRTTSGKTSVSLASWPVDLPLPTPDAALRFDPVQQTISCQGALPAQVARQLRDLTGDTSFRSAVEDLFVRSHQPPITDTLSYNTRDNGLRHPIRDLMIELDLQLESLQSVLEIKMTDGQYEFVGRLDFAERRAELTVVGGSIPLRVGTLPEVLFEQPVQIEMSLFDRQVLLAVNSQLVLEPYAYREKAEPAAGPRVPVAISAQGAPVQLLRQRVYRDVYYRGPTEDPTAPAREAEYRLGPDEYFVLGDNSARSIDSRQWPAGAVTGNLLIGRPVVLHLPSRKAAFSLGPYETRIRIPDTSRIRLLR